MRKGQMLVMVSMSMNPEDELKNQHVKIQVFKDDFGRNYRLYKKTDKWFVYTFDSILTNIREFKAL